MNDLRAPALLLDVLAALPPQLRAVQMYVLECLRNLSVVDMDLTTLPKTFLSETWETLLTSNEVRASRLSCMQASTMAVLSC